MMESHHIQPSSLEKGKTTYYTSGEPVKIIRFIDECIKMSCRVEKLSWKGNKLST
jgi:hypothetical protein